MSAAVSSIVFDDIFTINAIDKEGKKFDRGLSSLSSFRLTITSYTTVSRLYGHSKNYDMDLTLDYNVELFPLQKEQNVALALASSLARGGSSGGNADGSAEDERDVWRPDGKGSRGLEDDYDYVMYGKVRILCRSSYS
jgi:DNA-directed RNA polymerases I, II, and III subunit RPABC3